MSFEWKKYTIADVSKKVITGKTPPGTLDKYFGGEVLFVTPTDMGDNKYIELTQRTLSDEGEAKLAKQKFECGIVVSCIGWQMGKAAIVRNTAVTNQQINTIIPNGDLIDVDFLYYTLSEKRMEIFNLGATATRTPILKKSLFEKIEFHAPKLEQQKKIGNVLSSLDAKIISNKKINQTLEQMAQALFKSWFVDFEPVKAKMAVLEVGGSQADATLAAMTAISGKDADALAVFEREHPEHYAELKATAELFPSAMRESELGEIPQGWELKSFGDVSKCYDKKRIPLSKPQREKKKGEIPYYGATSIMDYVDEYIFDGIYLLLGEDGSVIKENGLPFTQYIWGKSWVNNHAHVLTGSESVTTEHLMVFIKQENIAAYVTGAVQMKLNQKNMNSIPFIFADEAVNNVFGQRIDSIYAVIRAKSEENLTLTNLRDTLLPKLLSGEITLPETEQAVSEAENV